jgi:hypothetical protein
MIITFDGNGFRFKTGLFGRISRSIIIIYVEKKYKFSLGE